MLSITHDDQSFTRDFHRSPHTLSRYIIGATVSEQGSITADNPRGWCGIFGRCFSRGWSIDDCAARLADRINQARHAISASVGWPKIHPATIPVMLWGAWGQPDPGSPDQGSPDSPLPTPDPRAPRDSMSWPTLEPHPALAALRSRIGGRLFAWCGSAHRPNTGTLAEPCHEALSERSLDRAVSCASHVLNYGLDGLAFDALSRVRTRDADIGRQLLDRIDDKHSSPVLMYERHITDAALRPWWRYAHGVITISPPGGKKPGVPWWTDPIEEVFDVAACAYRGWQPAVLCHAGDPERDLWTIDALNDVRAWLNRWDGCMILPLDLLRRLGMIPPLTEPAEVAASASDDEGGDA